MPGDAGVGMTDVGFGIPGTHQAKFSSKVMERWAPNFYTILRTQLQRACASIGCRPYLSPSQICAFFRPPPVASYLWLLDTAMCMT